jgi:hypothetical protein
VPEGKSATRFKARHIRFFLVYLLLLAAVACWRFIPRSWHPTLTLQTPHHTIYSTATRQQTEETAHPLELLYQAYSNRFRELPEFQPPSHRLKLKLYKDRDEMRAIHPSMGWAEAFYSSPYCHAYFSAKEINPYHWMLHESVHQLNHEVANLHLAKWLEEGLAEYFSTSRLLTNELAVGRIDPNTYPVWWMELIATTTNLDENIRNKSVIPLRAIIENRGGPSMNSHVNVYYLHWWTLTYFVFEDERYKSKALKLVERGGGLPAFENLIGPVEKIQPEWHAYVLHLKKTIAGIDRDFLKTGKVPPPSPAPRDE